MASTACITVLSYAYNSRYPDLGFWPPLMMLRQALATCFTTYMVARWSRNRYGTWYGRNAAGSGSTVTEARQIVESGNSLDGSKGRKGAEVPPEQQQHVAAGKAAANAGEWQEWGKLKSRPKAQHGTSDQTDELEGSAGSSQVVQPIPGTATAPAPPSSEPGIRAVQRVPPLPLSAAQHDPSLPYTEHAGAGTATAADATAPLRQVAATTSTAAKHALAGADVSASAGGGDGIAVGATSIRRTVSTAAAVATRPRYRRVVSYRTAVLKIPGYHPSDITPGFVQRLAQTLEQQQQQQPQQLQAHQLIKGATGGGAAASGEGQNAAGGGGFVRLKAAYVREGCIELGLYLEERVEVGGGAAGGADGAAAGGPGEQGWQGGKQEGDAMQYRAPGSSGTAFVEQGFVGPAVPGVRMWQLDRDSGVYRLLPAGAAGAAAAGAQGGGALARRVEDIIEALQLPRRDAPPGGSGAGAGAQQQGQGRRESRSGLAEAGAEEHAELVAMDASPRVVLVDAATGSGQLQRAAAAPIRFQLVVTHRVPAAGGLAATDAPQLTAELVLMQQQGQEGEGQERRYCRAVPCRVTPNSVDAAGAAEQYGSAGGTTRTVYDVEVDLDGLAFGPGPAEVGCGWLGGSRVGCRRLDIRGRAGVACMCILTLVGKQ